MADSVQDRRIIDGIANVMLWTFWRPEADGMRKLRAHQDSPRLVIDASYRGPRLGRVERAGVFPPDRWLVVCGDGNGSRQVALYQDAAVSGAPGECRMLSLRDYWKKLTETVTRCGARLPAIRKLPQGVDPFALFENAPVVPAGISSSITVRGQPRP
jgi:hypothetical protein